MDNVADNEVAAIFLVVPRHPMTMAEVWAWAGTAAAIAVPRLEMPAVQPLVAAPTSSRHPDSECPVCHRPMYSMHMKRHMAKAHPEVAAASAKSSRRRRA